MTEWAAFDPESILGALLRHQVDFVVIGGLAAVVRGAPLPTEDVDITPERSQRNLTRLSAALTELQARVRTGDQTVAFVHDGESLGAVETWNLATPYGDLDISFTPAGTTGYEDLVRDATTEAILGLQIRVASLADVIRSKQAANRLKDQRALPVLRDILATDSRSTQG